MKNLTWQNPEQLFVAQELINKVKSKCCGIKVLEELKGIKGEKVRIVKVDVDKHKEIAAYYQIQSVPTLMIFKNGKQLWRQSGVMRANDLSTILAQYE